MSLLTICQNALNELSGFDVPSSFYGSNNLTAKRCLALVRRTGATLERQYRWSELIDTYTFETVSGTGTYDLPSDFRTFANMSQWDRTNIRPMVGPTPGFVWQWLKSGIAAGSTIETWWRLEGANSFVLHPVPTTTRTLAFDYYSKNWITKQLDGSTTSEFASDNDTCRLDEELLTLALKWRFLQSLGMPYEPEYREYEQVLEDRIADGGGKGMINLGRRTMRMTNLPDTGFGHS